MNQNDIDLLTKNLMELGNAINLQKLVPYLLKNEVFTEELLECEIGMGSTPEQTRNMILGLMKRGPQAFDAFIQSLCEADQYEAAQMLRPHISVPRREAGGEEVFARHLPDIKEVVVKKAVKKYSGSPHSACYRMESSPRGLAAIFVNEFFEDQDNLHRPGASKDRHLMKDLFTQLGYETEVFEDLSRYETRKALQKFSEREEHATVDSCVVVFSSHGNVGGIMCNDALSISMQEIGDMFNNENCPKLKCKPKLFIVQACRGTMPDMGCPISGTDATGFSGTPNKATITDTLIAYSTLPEYLANRTEKGSWYLYLIAKVFMDHAWDTRLDDMLMEVNKQMDRLRADGGEKQSAETIWQGWQKKLYFNPGL